MKKIFFLLSLFVFTNIQSYAKVTCSAGNISISNGLVSGGSICAGATLSATISSGSGGGSGATNTNEYSLNGGTTWSTYTNGTIITASTAGSSIVKFRTTYSDTAACTSSPVATASLSVLALPNVSVNNATICIGASVVLTASGANSYAWSPSNGLSSTTGSTVTANPIATTTYTVVGTDANGCVNTASSIITYNSALTAPTVTATLANSSICKNSSTTLTAAGANTYTWSPSIGLSASTGVTVTANPSTTSTYLITGTGANGCTNIVSSTVIVMSLPTITVNSPSICKNSSATLNAGGAGTYTWSPSTGLNATSGSSVSANPTTTSTYTVTGTDANGCTNTASATVTIWSLPTITANSSSICKNSSATLTAGGASTYVWSPSTGLNATFGTSVTANPTTTSTYTVTGTDANGCTNNASATVTVWSLPTITVNSPSICKNSSVTLTAGGAGTYTWSPSTGLNATSGTSVSANPTTTSTYTVTGTDANGCTNTASATVTVWSLPTITVNSPSICKNSSATLTAVGASTYVWSPSTGLNATFGTSVAANPTTTSTYTVTGTDVNGCNSSTSTTVTVNQLPIASAGANQSMCSGGNISLNGSATVGNGIYTYSWTPTSGLSNPSIASPNASPISTTNYTLTVTDGNGCKSTPSTMTFSVYNNISIPLSPLSANLCSGNTLPSKLYVTTAGGTGLTYQWQYLNAGNWTAVANSTPAGTSYTGANTDTLRITGTSNVGNYPYRVIVSGGVGCTADTSVLALISVKAKPTALAGASQIVCAGSLATLNGAAIGGNGTYTYTWTTTSGVSLNNPNIAQPSFTSSNSGSYNFNLTVTDANGCTSQNTSAALITVNAKPTANAGASQIVCAGSSATLNGAATGGNGSYIYSWTPSIGLNNGNIAQPTASPKTNTVYYLTVTDSNGCSSTNNAAVTVNVTPNPVANTGSNVGICQGSSTQLAGAGGTSYSWTSLPVGFSSNSSSPVVTPTTTTTYNLTVTSNSCSATASVIVTVNPKPTANAGTSQTVCAGSLATLNGAATGGNGTYTYTWTTTSGVSLNNPNIAQPSFTSSNSGSYNFNLTVTDGNGCTSQNTSAALITVNAKPTANAGASQIVCAGSSATLNGAATGGNGSYIYSWTPSIGLNNGNIAQPSASPNTTTVYYLTVTDANGCSSTNNAAVTVSVTPNPVANAGSNVVICQGSSTQLAGTGGSNYLWTSSPSGFNSSSAVTSVSPNTTTTYNLTVTSNNCSATASVIVTVNAKPTANLVTNSYTICNGAPTPNFNASGAGASGSFSYSWSPSNGLSNASASNPTASPNTTTVYYLTVTDANGCSSINNASVTVNVNNKPTLQTSTTQTICEGTSTSLLVTGANSYSWSPSTGLNTTSGSSVIASPTSNITYKVIGTSNGCSDSSLVSVIVNVSPKPSIAGLSTPCQNSWWQKYSVQTNNTVQWSLDNGTLQSPTGDPTAYVHWGLSGNTTRIMVMETNASNYCKGYDTLVVNMTNNIAPDTVTINYKTGNLLVVYNALTYPMQWGIEGRQGQGVMLTCAGQDYCQYQTIDPFSYYYFVDINGGNSCVTRSYYNAPGFAMNTDAIENEDILIYPNPAENELTLTLPKTLIDGKIAIMNELGQLIYSNTINSQQQLINVRNMSNGQYHLLISDIKGNILHKSFIKQ